MPYTTPKNWKMSHIVIIYVMILFVPIIGYWNRYIFAESNLPFLLAILIIATIAFGYHRVPKDMIFSATTFFAPKINMAPPAEAAYSNGSPGAA